MSHSEDPPYLTVGTEVSAKYRGAFCEATIKVAKKLVKCKVSYGKGQAALLSHDQISGHLKVGGQVDVKQADGRLVPATITKLTDHSTYTVVFDDGDERTLKRSSLCLKGGRHFHESESLDHLPLTDPENFGTPVMNSSSKKLGRKRRRGSHSPASSTRDSPSKRRCDYPSEFPVGKAVFLVNDRRRSSWLPAVIVPAHYVLEADEMTPDTICLRSFKDGRYFAATKNELHDFSPEKEPLLSMLEGEIQAMYMCKPAIERAMAYIDTGELPWDMDLCLQHKSERHGLAHASASDPSTSDDDDVQKSKEKVECDRFEAQFQQFQESRGVAVQRHPTIGQHHLNLFHLYRLVKANGGMDKVTQEMKWRSLYLQLGLPLNSSASQSLRQAYRKYLYQFELHENKAKSSGKESRHSKPLPPSSDDDQESSTQDQSNREEHNKQQQDRDKERERVLRQEKLKQHDKAKQLDKTSIENKSRHVVCGKEVVSEAGSKAKMNGVDKPKKVGEQRAMKMVRMEKLQSKHFPLVKRPATEPEGDREAEEDKNCISDSKSEGGSDLELTPNGPAHVDESWNGEDMEIELERGTSLSTIQLERAGVDVSDLEQCPEGYKLNDRVLVLYGKGKTLRTYEAKVVEVEENESKRDYLVHYNGWNTRYDEWIDCSRIAGKLTGPVKSRPHIYAKRKKTPKSASSNTMVFTPSKIPPNAPSYSAKFILSTSSKLVLSPPNTSSTPVLSPPPTSSSSSSSSSSSKLLNSSASSKLVLSPSLQAIICGQAPQQAKKHKKGKGYDSISGKDISNRPPLSLKPPPTSSSAEARSVRRAGRNRGLKMDYPKNKMELSERESKSGMDASGTDGSATNSNSSSPPTSPTSPNAEPTIKCSDSSEEEELSTTVAATTTTTTATLATTLKQEQNELWRCSPPPTLPPPVSSSPSSSTLSVSTCDSLPGSSAKPLPPSVSSPSALSLAEPAAHSLLSLSTAVTSFPPLHATPQLQTTPPYSTPPKSPSLGSTSPVDEERHHYHEEKQEEEKEDKMAAGGSISSGMDSVGALECGEQKLSASDSEGSLSRVHSVAVPKACLSASPDGGKKKWHVHEQESPEDYQKRRQERQAGMIYTLDFSQLPPMSSVERVLLIQQRLKEVQRHWTDLKAEMAYIERKRRRAKRKEREAAHSVAAPPPSVPASSSPPHSPHHKSQLNNSAISCH